MWFNTSDTACSCSHATCVSLHHSQSRSSWRSDVIMSNGLGGELWSVSLIKPLIGKRQTYLSQTPFVRCVHRIREHPELCPVIGCC